MQKKKFNDETWQFEVYLFQMSTLEQLKFNIENVLTIKLYNSLQGNYPKLTLEYADFQFELSNKLENNRFYLYLAIEEPKSKLNNDNPLFYSGIFSIVDIKIIKKEKDYITYSFLCEDINKSLLYQNVNYANNKLDGPVSPYKIISDICSKIDVQFNDNYIDTTHKIDFISSQSMTALDIINYCVEAGVDKKNRPSYFTFNMIQDSYWLFNPDLDINSSINPYLIYSLNMHIVVPGNINDADTAKIQFADLFQLKTDFMRGQ